MGQVRRDVRSHVWRRLMVVVFLTLIVCVTFLGALNMQIRYKYSLRPKTECERLLHERSQAYEAFHRLTLNSLRDQQMELISYIDRRLDEANKREQQLLGLP